MSGIRAAAAALICCVAFPAVPGIGAAALLCVSDEGVHCFTPEHSAPIWQRLRGRTTYTPVKVSELLITGGGEGVVAFTRDGARRWQLVDFGHAFTPTVADDELFFGTLGGSLVSAGTDGSVRWQKNYAGWMYSPAVIGSVVVSGGQSGVLHAVHRGTGDALWELSLDQELVHRLVVVDGRHFVATTFAGTLLKLEAQTGRVAWRRNFSVPSKSPAVAGGVLLCALFDGRVVAIAGSDGSTRWETALPADVELALRLDKVAAYSDERLSVLHAGDGEILLDREFATPIIAAHWLDDRRIAIILRDLRNQVRLETVHL